MNFDLKRPCANCPFKKKGAIELRPGRVEGIIDDLTNDDTIHFMCHKTVYNRKTGGHHEEDEDGESTYIASGNESQCTGSMIYLLKAGAPNVSMRLAAALGMLDFDELRAQADTIIDPIA